MFERAKKFIKYMKLGDYFLRRILLVLFICSFMVFSYPSVPEIKALASGEELNQVESVSLPESGAEKIRSKYNSSMENGFCLFGYRSSNKIVVRDVDFVESPVDQSYGSITHYCMDEIINRSKSLLTRTDYQLIGNVHTHPGEADLSRRDIFSFGVTSPFQRTYGVYNGFHLFFATKNDLNGVNVEVRS